MTGEDIVTALVAFAHQLHATPSQVRMASVRLETGAPTLSEAVADIERLTRQPVTGRNKDGTARYPEGRRRFLDGDESAEIPGYAQQRIHSVRVDELQANIEQLHASVGRREIERLGEDPDSPGGRDRARQHGHAAAEQYVRAIHAIGKALERAELTATAPWQSVTAPKRPGPTRDQALTVSELRDYLRVILAHSLDPRLHALLWMLLRTTALRNSEVLRLAVDRVNPSQARISVFGKGQRFREHPAATPLLAALLELHQQRRLEPRETALLLRPDGTRVTGRDFNVWSELLHEHVSWAKGHRLAVHCLRHTAARLVAQKVGGPSVSSTLYLGDSVDGQLGTIAHYLHSPHVNEYDLRAGLYEQCFGDLHSWPRLPENDLLSAALGVELPSIGGER